VLAKVWVSATVVRQPVAIKAAPARAAKIIFFIRQTMQPKTPGASSTIHAGNFATFIPPRF
jgi:hypothetical protein